MLSQKYIQHYMSLAHFMANDISTCYSRKIGAITIDPVRNRIVSTGFNGPPRGVPHCDSRIFVQKWLMPKLTPEEQKCTFIGTKKCPRQILGAASGTRLDLCICQHAETNAIINAQCNLTGTILFTTCAPCKDCAGAIIQAGIKLIYIPNTIYTKSALWLLEQANIPIVFVNPNIS